MSNDAILPLLTYTIFKHLSLGEIIFGEEKNHLINPEFSPSKWASGISTIPTPGSKNPWLSKPLVHIIFQSTKTHAFSIAMVSNATEMQVAWADFRQQLHIQNWDLLESLCHQSAIILTTLRRINSCWWSIETHQLPNAHHICSFLLSLLGKKKWRLLYKN